MVSFSRGAPPPGAPFEAGLLPLSQKEDLCRSLLDEFAAVSVRERVSDHELIHGCLVNPTHQNQVREPTASLNYEKLTYRCLGCGARGGLLWLIATVRNSTTDDARLWLNSETGLGGSVMDLSLLMKFIDALYKPSRGLPPIPTYPTSMLGPWNLIHPYLTDPRPDGRAIPEENVLRMSLGYAEQYPLGEEEDGRPRRTSERIIIPHFWKGDLVGWQTRRLDSSDGTPKYLSSPDFPKDYTIYNYEPRHRGKVVVMEAALSAVSKVHLDPHPEATFGASLTDYQLTLLAKHERIVLFMDNDDAGWKAVEGYDTYWPNSTRVKEHHEGMGEILGRSSNVFVVDNPWAADPQDLSDEDYLMLVDQAVPFSVWQRPTRLLCYRCDQTAHEGPCQGRG